MNQTPQDLKATLQRKLATAKEQLAAFKVKLKHDPVHAFNWGIAAYEGAAMLRVGSQVILHLKNGATLKAIRQEALRQVTVGALNPPHSTSPTSNLMEECLTQAWAVVNELIDEEV